MSNVGRINCQLTTKVGTIPGHNENLILIDPKSGEQIFNSIKNIIDDNNLRIRLAKNEHIFASNTSHLRRYYQILARPLKKSLQKNDIFPIN